MLAPALSRMPGSWVEGGAATMISLGKSTRLGVDNFEHPYGGGYGQPSLATCSG